MPLVPADGAMEASPHVVGVCIDGQVAIAASEFAALVVAGRLLGALAYDLPVGEHLDTPRSERLSPLLMRTPQSHRPYMRVTCFKTYGVSVRALNVLRACVRNRDLPADAIAREMYESGELRHANDALGGFEVVDAILARTFVALPRTPSDDVTRAFTWRSIETMGSPHWTQKRWEAYQELGYEYASHEELGTHIQSAVYHFRKPRVDAETRSAEEVDSA